MQGKASPYDAQIVLEAKELQYDYPDGTSALQGLSIRLHEGERLALLGANGSGKSTLMLHLSGCLSAASGHVSVCILCKRTIPSGKFISFCRFC